MLLLALAIAPGIAICLFIYSRDVYGREPLPALAISFLLGAISTIPAWFAEMYSGHVNPSEPVINYAAFAYCVVGFSEEGCKFLVLRWYAYRKQSFDEPFDGIVYAVMISMGFATVENIEYVWFYGADVGIARFFLAVPAHAAFAVLMGYYVGMAKFVPQGSVWLLLKGLLIAVFFHGSFDFFLFLQQSDYARQYVSTGLLSFGAFASFYLSFRMAMRAIRMHRVIGTMPQGSEENFQEKD
jgi:RsiW-degrading membrane proteinase PrsW (M82 family)